MNRKEAFLKLKEGKKISHRYFCDSEYYHMIGDKIMSEDNVNHTEVFWSNDDNNWREEGWILFD